MNWLTEEILQSVEKPARYVGGEWNAARKRDARCRLALALPDVYEVGMSNLGLKILYEVVNAHSDLAAERVYAPWPDMAAALRQHGEPLRSLETQTPLAEFDVLGFSLQYELSYTNVLEMLDLAGVPLWAHERGDDDPLVIAGGPCAYNVEPMADFFDAVIIGEGEEVLPELLRVVADWSRAGRPGGRAALLQRAASLGGVYVPSLYAVAYEGDDVAVTPLRGAPPVVLKRVVADLDAVATMTRPVVPSIDIVHNRALLELFRGCTRGCRFCQAGVAYRPVRERSPQRLRELARSLLDSTGYDEMSLTSLSSADYSALPELLDALHADLAGERVSLSLPSLRIDSFSVDLAQRLSGGRKSGLTFAPEAGTQRLRDVINKGVSESDLMSAVGAAFRHGWKAVKLYFMLGLPTETDADLIGIADLAGKVAALYRDITHRRDVRVTVSVACFVPKPFTPFQWCAQVGADELHRRQQVIKSHLTDRAVQYNYHDAATSTLEGVLARGDRRLAAVIAAAWRLGATFDGWSERFNAAAWQRAFDDCHLDAARYNERERAADERFAWEHTTPGVSREFLRREFDRALSATLTRDCRRAACNGCDICQRLGVGIIDGGRHDHP